MKDMARTAIEIQRSLVRQFDNKWVTVDTLKIH